MTTTIKPTSPIAPSAPPQPPRPSLAMALDPERALHLAPTFQPDVDLLTAEGLIAFGVKGSGKSNLLALLAEQLGRFLLPQLILDTEREYQSLLSVLPRGVLAMASRFPSGADLLHQGLQVIVDLHSWESDEAAALAMCQLIDELFGATNALTPQERVPCIIHLDEAAYWLPQEAVSYLSKERRKGLADAFHKLASRGRKQGLTPFLYTQSISEVAKSVIRQAGIKVLMRQTLDVDLTRYCQYIQGATAQTKKAIAAYPSGKAVVLLPDGSQHRVQLYQRQSEHVSQSPRSQAALVKFAGRPVDVAALAMRDLTSSGAAEVEQQGKRQPVPTPQQAGRGRPTTPTQKSAREQVDAFLSVNPTLRVVELMKLVGCSETFARKARKVYFARHPEQAAAAGLDKGQPSVSERVHALLAKKPTLRVAELMQLVGCGKTAASRARLSYLAAHPEQALLAQSASISPSVTQQAQDLLEENPTLRPIDLIKRVGCSPTLAYRVHQTYFEQHPELAPPTRITATERIQHLLSQNPMLRPVDLRKQVGCDLALAARVHHAYFERHPEWQAGAEPAERNA